MPEVQGTLSMEQFIFHWKYYLSLEKDLAETSQYVDHCYENRAAFSNEFAKLILLACSEIDVICKTMCKIYKPESNPKIICEYAKIILAHSTIINTEKIYLADYVICPWQDWKLEPYSSPDWWRDYQDIKHNRSEHFSKANLENAISSMAGLYVLLYSISIKSNRFEARDVMLNTRTYINSIGFLF
jgi:hypothetical protein